MSTYPLSVPSKVTVTGGRATATALVRNPSEAEVRLALVATGPAGGGGGESWTSVADPLREVPPGGSAEYTVTFAPSPQVTEGTYRVRLIAYPVDAVPEEYADQAAEIEVTVPGVVVPPPPVKSRWWLYVVAAALVLVAAVVAILIGTGGPDGPKPTTSPSAPTSPTPTPTPRFDAATVSVVGRVVLQTNFPLTPERTFPVSRTIAVTAGTTETFAWHACLPAFIDSVQGYLDLDLSLDRQTGQVTAVGLARYSGGPQCAERDGRAREAVSLTVSPHTSRNYLTTLRDSNGSVSFYLAISNDPSSSTGP